MPVLHEQYEDLAKQEASARLGMWAFLASESLLFAGLFALYVAYRDMYGADFRAAAHHNNRLLGTLNTVVLVTSSFTVAWAIHAVRRAKPRVATACLALTLLFGATFMVIKGFEYHHHLEEGIAPGALYHDAEMPSYGARTFFTLYYLLTGLHALHVIGGMSFLAWLMLRVRRGVYTPEHHLGLELGGLYWHLVDLIWIYLWPLLYLVR